MVQVPANSPPNAVLSIDHNGRNFHVNVPPGLAPGAHFVVRVPAAGGPPPSAAPQPPPPQQAAVESPRRGRRVQLPQDFLRLPGWQDPQAASAGGGADNNGEMTDEQLAMLLQDESFLQELASHPDFRQLHLEQERILAAAAQGQQAQAQPQAQNQPQRRTSMFGRSTSSRAPPPAAPGGSSGGSTSRVPSMAGMTEAMRSRLKQLGSKFTRRQQHQYGYVSTADGEETLPWGDDTEMVTFSSTSSALHTNVQPEAEPGAGGSGDEPVHHVPATFVHAPSATFEEGGQEAEFAPLPSTPVGGDAAGGGGGGGSNAPGTGKEPQVVAHSTVML